MASNPNETNEKSFEWRKKKKQKNSNHRIKNENEEIPFKFIRNVRILNDPNTDWRNLNVYVYDYGFSSLFSNHFAILRILRIHIFPFGFVDCCYVCVFFSRKIAEQINSKQEQFVFARFVCDHHVWTRTIKLKRPTATASVKLMLLFVGYKQNKCCYYSV